ncbi:hypothetical protein ERO13_A10G168450v2 [Gossypium hirsutum]|uniref:Uncharacterized protein n=2 Tax=Gossypium TaxID=3633 RepID=A0A5J5U8K6_GOSBA|nr:hypothetical protein ES319_A10G181400v1 [Gossypium barbadense]KAG4180484.1 hypothetical protein ERO13_A10G168450v2 [Gossypium hirsutum]TYJ15455.1 hypothetical protein E1A91_A10G185200v1 [Gossypium mustelinum]
MAFRIKSVQHWPENHHYLFSPPNSYFPSLLFSPIDKQPNNTLNPIFISQYQRYSPNCSPSIFLHRLLYKIRQPVKKISIHFPP